MDRAGCAWAGSEGSKVNRVGWLECDGAEAFRSRRRCWLELPSSAGEERGPCAAAAMFLRASVSREEARCEGQGREGGRRKGGCEGQRQRASSRSVLTARLLAQGLRAAPGVARRPPSPAPPAPPPGGEAALGPGVDPGAGATPAVGKGTPLPPRSLGAPGASPPSELAGFIK